MNPQTTPVSDALVLTLHNERRFYGLVRLLVSGLASQFDLPYEQMDDLQLALETVLARDSRQGEEVTLRIEPREESIVAWLRPVDEQEADEGQPGQIGLGRVLASLVDVVEVVSLDGERWLCLEQRIPPRSPS
jgi:anti-sigma regulatory factor (Ser/Thr protein kinase)